MRGVVLLVCLCACKQFFGLDDPAGANDSGIHEDGPRADAQLCWSVPQVSLDFCLDSPLSGDVTVSSTQPVDIDGNGTGLECTPSTNPALCVIAAETITITATGVLQARGGKPLVLVGRTILMQGTLDVASHFGMPHGAGGDAGPCTPGSAATGRGGGAGGSFGTKGGNGGDQAGVGNSRAAAGQVIVGVQFRGGCPGSNGGGSLGHGSGGGAVALLAGSITLTPTATINASGAAGAAGDGGNGAGSGGMIVLQTSALTATAGSSIFANGGGGGGAGAPNQAGVNGSDPTGPTVGGQHGTGAGLDSGDGGDGYPAVEALRNGVNGAGDAAGGGGGGGGAGVIRVFGATLPPGGVSPPPS